MMSFRSKSPERAFDELKFLSETYGRKRIDCVDNILEMKYINTLFPKLRDSGLGIELFYEVKSNLHYKQLLTLYEGGLRGIQPGIESFSNEVLRLMKKGCTGLQNIQLIRWCAELGIDVAYNILTGFPDESPSEYERMIVRPESALWAGVMLFGMGGYLDGRLNKFLGFETMKEATVYSIAVGYPA